MSEAYRLARFGELLSGLLSESHASWSVTESGDPFHPALVITTAAPVSYDIRAQIRDLIAENVPAARRPSVIYKPEEQQ
jgi:hypothetical protein